MMSFDLLRIADKISGRILIFILAPICAVVRRLFGPKPAQTQKVFSFLKLHGGGSLLIALPALLGIRKKYPDALFILTCTEETRKYAELTGLFNDYIVIQRGNPLALLVTGLKGLLESFRHDVCVDLEPHSFLAAVFCLLTFSDRRIGLVKGSELHRASAYTDAVYFNLHAPIHVFYEQIAGLLDATAADDEECRRTLRANCTNGASPLDGDHPRPLIYVCAFSSDLAPERMMPTEIWVAQLKQAFGTAPYTIILGGTVRDIGSAGAMAAQLGAQMPAAKILNLCGERTLKQSAYDIGKADQCWSVDTGPLHIARFLSKHCRSYWGPTSPYILLKKIEGLEEETVYQNYPCSPCVHVTLKSPCGGDNQCLKSLLAPPSTPKPIILK